VLDLLVGVFDELEERDDLEPGSGDLSRARHGPAIAGAPESGRKEGVCKRLPTAAPRRFFRPVSTSSDSGDRHIDDHPERAAPEVSGSRSRSSTRRIRTDASAMTDPRHMEDYPTHTRAAKSSGVLLITAITVDCAGKL
jgi:hypothetical protein